MEPILTCFSGTVRAKKYFSIKSTKSIDIIEIFISLLLLIR